MNTVLSPFDDVCCLKPRQTAQPKTCSFCLTVAEFIWLYDLICLPPKRGHNADWIFDRRHWNVARIPNNPHEKCNSLLLPSVHALFNKMSRSAYGKMCAFRVEYRQIPRIVDHIEQIALVMMAWLLRLKKIAGHGVMAARYKCIAYHAREFATDEHFHAAHPTIGSISTTKAAASRRKSDGPTRCAASS